VSTPAIIDPRWVLRAGTMSEFQVGIITVCVLIAGLDGFDVLVVAFTATALANEWMLSPSALGVVLSAGLAGMGLGALVMGPAGDRLGRRPAVLLCLIGLAVGMALSAVATSVGLFAATRFFTGLWIGGVLANINIVVVEYSSDRRRKLCVALMTLGYPIGATLGGLAAVYLLSTYGWRSVYWFGAAAAVVLFPLAGSGRPSRWTSCWRGGRPARSTHSTGSSRESGNGRSTRFPTLRVGTQTSARWPSSVRRIAPRWSRHARRTSA
jgi:MFS family permease